MTHIRAPGPLPDFQAFRPRSSLLYACCPRCSSWLISAFACCTTVNIGAKSLWLSAVNDRCMSWPVTWQQSVNTCIVLIGAVSTGPRSEWKEYTQHWDFRLSWTGWWTLAGGGGVVLGKSSKTERVLPQLQTVLIYNVVFVVRKI
jgi:hypothetical protein